MSPPSPPTNLNPYLGKRSPALCRGWLRNVVRRLRPSASNPFPHHFDISPSNIPGSRQSSPPPFHPSHGPRTTKGGGDPSSGCAPTNGALQVECQTQSHVNHQKYIECGIWQLSYFFSPWVCFYPHLQSCVLTENSLKDGRVLELHHVVYHSALRINSTNRICCLCGPLHFSPFSKRPGSRLDTWCPIKFMANKFMIPALACHITTPLACVCSGSIQPFIPLARFRYSPSTP